MTAQNLFHYHYATFTNAQLPLLKVAALYFDKLYILDPVGASCVTIGAVRHVCKAIMQLKDAGILQGVTPGRCLDEGSFSEASRTAMLSFQQGNALEAPGELEEQRSKLVDPEVDALKPKLLLPRGQRARANGKELRNLDTKLSQAMPPSV